VARAAAWFGVSKASIFAALTALVLFAAVLHAAWLCDDAFITLRTTDNWVHGHGLRWNIAERVQAYTHPLWLFLVTIWYSLGHQPSIALLVPALLCTAAFLALFVRTAPDPWLAGSSLLVLLASKAFVEFSTSGLENPLLHLLLLFYCLALGPVFREKSGLFQVFLWAALSLVTRPDVAFLLAPSLVWAMFVARAELRKPRTYLALAPLAAWELFSLFYYGFPLPNSAYARLDAALPRAEAFVQGFQFLRASLTHDPVTLTAIVLALLFGIAKRKSLPTSLGLGLLCWLLYLVAIGGDFMLGRLLTPALVMAVLIARQAIPSALARCSPLFAAPLVLVAIGMPRSALLGPPRDESIGWLPEKVRDERAIFYQFTGLFRDSHPEGPRSHPSAREALARRDRGERLFTGHPVGFAGYFAGATVHIVDELAQADPLLARLPAIPNWFPGQLERSLPKGYLATLDRAPNRLEPASLAKHYDTLALVIHGPLFSLERLKAILRRQLRRKPIYPPDYRMNVVKLKTPRSGDILAKGAWKTSEQREQGFVFVLNAPAAISGLNLSVSADDHFSLALRKGRKVLWRESLDATGAKGMADHSFTFAEPMQVDSLSIRGRRGDYRYQVGAVRLSRAPESPAK
jgi:arabinofuranosyltransferase